MVTNQIYSFFSLDTNGSAQSIARLSGTKNKQEFAKNVQYKGMVLALLDFIRAVAIK